MGFPQPPGARIAYDIDGTVGFLSQTAGPLFGVPQLSQPALAALNSDNLPLLEVSGAHTNSIYSPDLRGEWRMSASTSSPEQRNFIALLFPQPMRIRGLFAFSSMAAYDGGSGDPNDPAYLPNHIQTSTDTTNGLDGTWTTVFSDTAPMSRGFVHNYDYWAATEDPTVLPQLGVSYFGPDDANRTMFPYLAGRWKNGDTDSLGEGWVALGSAYCRNVKAVRLYFDSWPPPENFTTEVQNSWLHTSVHKLHLYGEPDTNAHEHRLEFIDVDGNPKLFNWGDVSNGDVLIQTFKLRNVSPSMDADVVELSAVASNGTTTPAPHAGIEFSLSGNTWSSGLSISKVAAGQDSAVLYLRLTVPASGIQGFWTPRITAETGEWV